MVEDITFASTIKRFERIGNRFS